MTAVLQQVPLRIEFAFAGYQKLGYDLGDLPCQSVAGHLARTLVEMCGTRGDIASPRTAAEYVHAIRDMCLFLHEEGFAGHVEEVPGPLVYDMFKSAATERRERRYRALILRDPTLAWSAAAVEQAHGRDFKARQRDTPTPPYSPAETKRLRDRCSEILARAESLQQEADRILTSGPTAPTSVPVRHHHRDRDTPHAVDVEGTCASLREAASRLLTGRPLRSDGLLSKRALFDEAGLPLHRGTNPAVKVVVDEILLDFRARTDGRRVRRDYRYANDDECLAAIREASTRLFGAASEGRVPSMADLAGAVGVNVSHFRREPFAAAAEDFRREAKRRRSAIVAVAPWGQREDMLRLVEQHGALTRTDLIQRLDLAASGWILDEYLPDIVWAHESLYPSHDVLWAARVLLGLATGIPPEGLDTLALSDIEWPGRNTVRISYRKERGAGTSSASFERRGPLSAPAIIERWMSLTERARRRLPEEDQAAFWIGWIPVQGLTRGIARLAVWGKRSRRVWARDQHLIGDDGATLVLNWHRIRATYFAEQDRRFHHALPIDPNHSRAVEDDHYVGHTRPTEVIQTAIEEAQLESVRRAELAGPLVIATLDELARLHEDPDAAAERMATTPTAARAVLQGSRDVFLSACKDFTHSPFTPAGEPCSAAAWSCLFCELAVFTPSKLPNLLRFKDFLERAWQGMSQPEFEAAYGAAYTRLMRDILPRFPLEVVAAARAMADSDPDPLYLPAEVSSQHA